MTMDEEIDHEYWVHEIKGVTSEVVATFPSETAARAWAERNYDTIHEETQGEIGGVFIKEVRRFK